jgi:UDP:flavonoid glycosyltransferase YjiC (YdhE family)
VEGEGLNFHPVRPDLAGVLDQPEVIRRVFHPRTGTEYIVRRLFLPALEAAFEDTLAAARDADLIVGHPIAYATPLAAEVLGKPWISVALAPISMLSTHDPPSISGAPFLELFRSAGPAFWRNWWGLAGLVTRRWGRPIHRLRARLSLPPVGDPILRGTFSPLATQAWFSGLLAEPQPDWPADTRVTGFPFYDRLEPTECMSESLREFLAEGSAPIVFTLGSAAVFDAGAFYVESLEAARLIGRRAVLLTGRDPRNRPQHALPADVFIAEYAPYSELFPHAAAIVHQGGIGTTAQALRSGRPMVVVPFSHDQPDNARRAVKLGVAATIPRNSYSARRVARELAGLLGDPAVLARAEAAGDLVSAEDGVGHACSSLEAILAGVS